MAGVWLSMQPPLPLRLPPLPHNQFQFLPLHIGQQPEQGLLFFQGHPGQVHAGSLAQWAVGACQAGLIAVSENTKGLK